VFVESCGLLEMVELRDAFIRKLNTFALNIPEDAGAADSGERPLLTGPHLHSLATKKADYLT